MRCRCAVAEKAVGEVIGQAQVKLIWIAMSHTGATTVATIAIAIIIIGAERTIRMERKN